MKVICGKEELIKGIQIVSPVVSSKSALPALSNFLFETESDKIKLSSTDLEIAVRCYVKGEIIEEGGITIPAKRFADIVKELSDDSEIEIRADETNHIDMKSGKSKFNLMGISKTEYPVIPESPKGNSFTVKKEIFASMLKKTIFAVSRDSQRYILNGVYFIVEDNKLKMAATDGRRLAYAKTTIQTGIKGKAIVPTKAVSDMLRLLSPDLKSENIQIGITNNRISVEIDDITLLSTLVEGLFPNYEQVIPKKTGLKVKLNVKGTLTAVKQMAILIGDRLSSDRSSAIKFYFSPDLLRISASAAGIGSGEVDLEIEYKNEPAEINFNPSFIKEILQNIDEDFVIFEFIDSLNPAVMSPEKDKDYLCVVMPMRV
ncbi:MAG: DNA polymerase III subunit beta [Endomicrobium sp.]|jgi:DNA polymerase-3 subunit beta|nr:DNA polymerase III subunit beta [Endomicrobium sp.]